MINITDSDRSLKCATAAALGIFDGVHSGHRRVIDKAVETAAENGIIPAVFTFSTASVTSKGSGGIEQLLTDSDKLKKLGEAGIEYVYSPDFTQLRDMSAESFVRDILKNRLNAQFAVCGRDFRFGRGGNADSLELKRLCGEYGIEVLIEDQLESGGEVVSSTLIRRLIKEGSIAEANRLLGYNFGCCLRVEHGNEIGRTWDFPTINQLLPERLVLPKFGVYCSKVYVDGEWREAITNIGVKPTVEKTQPPLAETFIINFSGDLYGKEIPLELHEFVRPERVFASFDELKKEIADNTEYVKKYFGIK